MPDVIAPGADKVGTVWAISAETGKTTVEARTARRHDVARRHRRRTGLRRRRQRAVQGARRQDRQGAVGGEPRLAGQRLSRSRSRVDGKQYVAVTTGPSLVAGSSGRVVPELKPGSNSGVYVFALP